jgi:hypothetical protein
VSSVGFGVFGIGFVTDLAFDLFGARERVAIFDLSVLAMTVRASKNMFLLIRFGVENLFVS